MEIISEPSVKPWIGMIFANTPSRNLKPKPSLKHLLRNLSAWVKEQPYNLKKGVYCIGRLSKPRMMFAEFENHKLCAEKVYFSKSSCEIINFKIKNLDY